VDEARAAGDSAAMVVGDLSDRAAIEDVGKRVLTDHGRVDVLVNNAGGNSLEAIDKMDPEAWWKQLELNVRCPHLLCRAFVPGMVTRRWGRVINVASRLGKIGAPMATSYCSAKHALIGFTRALALEVAESGVTVNAVCPGHVETSLMDGVFEQRA